MGRAFHIAHWILIGLAVFCAAAIDLGGIPKSVARDGHYVGDFTVFWTAAKSDPAIIYDIGAISRAQAPLLGGEKGARPFLNPPSLLPWLAPFAQLPLLPALALWSALGLLAFGWASWRLVSWKMVGLIILAPPFVLAVVTGQVTLFVSAAVIVSLTQVRTRPLLAGVLFGIAATIKPQAVLLAPLALVAGGHWRTLLAAAATGVLIGLACLLFQGPALWISWRDALSGFGEIAQRSYLMRRGATPANLVYLMGLTGPAALAVRIGGVALGLATVWVTFRATEDVTLRLGALVAGSILCIPYAMPYEVLPLLIPATIMLLDRDRPVLWLVGFLLVTQLILPLGVMAMAVALLWLALSGGSPPRLRGLGGEAFSRATAPSEQRAG